jgi:transcriptional regulator with XRE-family HTH domain
MGANKERFTSRLRQLRQERGYAAARHFAQALGLPENRYSRYERGDSEPDIELIYAFCEKLPASPDELFGFDAPASMQGFSSGPQALLKRADQPIDDHDRHATSPANPLMATEAAAWRLAATLARLKSGRAASEPANLAELRATAQLFAALRNDPYETVARLVDGPEIAGLAVSATREVEMAIEQFLAGLH